MFAPNAAGAQSVWLLPGELTSRIALRSEHWPSPCDWSSNVVVTLIVAAAAEPAATPMNPATSTAATSKRARTIVPPIR